MKRCWFGLGLLVALLAGSLALSWYMDQAHAPMAEAIDQAAQRALINDWGNAEALAQKAKGSWEKHWHINATFADHEPMESIDSLFAQLEVYADSHDPVSFAATCAQLRIRLEAMGDAHGLDWWNLL